MKPEKSDKILVVDDEADILSLLEYNLKKAGFKVGTAKDGPDAIEAAHRETPALILLDIMLPGMDGTEVLRRLKASERTRGIPVMMLTAKGEEVDKIVGFELGAEDYITKPFSPRELLLRLKAVLKRSSSQLKASDIEKTFSCEGLRVDFSSHRVTAGADAVSLSPKEFRLLSELVNCRGRVLSRDTLLDRVWGIDCFVIPRAVDTHIRRLRKKLKSAGKYIETIRGAGYMFKGDF